MSTEDHGLLIERTLRWTELFSEWPHRRIEELVRAARLMRYARQAQVLADDRKRRELLVVASGLLEISYSTDEGKKYVQSFASPGNVVGLVRLLEEVTVPYDYHAHVDSVVVHLPSDAVLAVLDAEPVLWRDVARLGLRRQRDSIASLRSQVLGSNRRRISNVLSALAQQTHTPLRDGQALSVELSQGELATMLGISRQTMNKELRALAEEGIVDAVYKRITILDARALARIASEG